jgi:transposase
VKGRKRHLLVDTNGFILYVLVHEANIQDHTGGKLLLSPLKGCFPRLKLIWADSAYKKEGFAAWVLEWPAMGLGTKGRGDRWGADPSQRLPCPQVALDRRTHGGLAFASSAGSPKTMKCSHPVKKLGSALP